MAVTLNGVMYYYSVNAQGDVTGIFTATGTDLCRYVYDAWGRIVYQSGDSYIITTLNPLRYRGYVYDSETELYYLQSRYYNPEWGRFISADSSVSTGQGLLGNNMFTYCLNSPTNGCDPCGTCFHRWDFWNDCEKCGGKTIGDRWNDVTTWCTDAYTYVTNDDPQVAQSNLQKDNFSFYKGTMVFSLDLPFGNPAASFGVILMDTYYETSRISVFTDTLNHEHGHFEHMKQIGIGAYTVTTAIPSLIGAGIADYHGTGLRKFVYDNYKSQPWERIADQLGGVTNGTYLPGANTAGFLYWLYTQFVSMLFY